MFSFPYCLIVSFKIRFVSSSQLKSPASSKGYKIQSKMQNKITQNLKKVKNQDREQEIKQEREDLVNIHVIKHEAG